METNDPVTYLKKVFGKKEVDKIGVENLEVLFMFCHVLQEKLGYPLHLECSNHGNKINITIKGVDVS